MNDPFLIPRLLYSTEDLREWAKRFFPHLLPLHGFVCVVAILLNRRE